MTALRLVTIAILLTGASVHAQSPGEIAFWESGVLTIWYAPKAKRAIKYSSRLTIGDLPPIDANFDLELTSYQLK